MGVTKVTQKGQITIPKPVRDALGINQSDYVVVVLDGDRAILSPVREQRVAGLKGSLPATRPYPGTDKIRREVGRDLGRRSE